MPSRPTSHFLLHACVLITVILLLSFWHRSSLVLWTPQALAVLAIVYVFFNRFVLPRWLINHAMWAVTLESAAALLITIELTELTGGLSGPAAWTVYLLIVWLTLQLETSIAIVTGLGLLAFFLPATSLFPPELILREVRQNPNLLLADAARLIGLLATIPLALYIGHRFKHRIT